MATEKRSIGNDNLTFNVSTIIVDIEGTTTSINFVKETLFPYVRETLNEYVESNWSDKTFQDDVSLLREQATKDLEDKLEGAVEIPVGDDDNVKKSVINNVLWQMDNDRKTKALKQLQGHIWKGGYSSGKLVGHIYDEVKECLQSWTESGKKIYVYSSGSVEAQKLLFGSTKKGDLLSLFSGYFDTAVGPKTEASSYNKILEQVKESGHISGPKDALFLTDIPNEAKAAAEAGLETAIVVREGNAPLPEDIKETFPVISSFCDLIFEGNIKRRKLSSEKLVESNENDEGGKVKEEVKDIEMDVCPSENNTTETVVNGKSEESVESGKVPEDSVVSSKTEKVENQNAVVVEEAKTNVKEAKDLVNENDNSAEKDSDAVEKMDESIEIAKAETEPDVKESADKSKCSETKTEETNETKVTEKEENVEEKVVERVSDVETKEDNDNIKPEPKQTDKNEPLNSESDKVQEDVEEKKPEETVEMKINGEVEEKGDEISEKKDDAEVRTGEETANEKTNGEVKSDDNVKEIVEEKQKESQNGEVEMVVNTEPVKKEIVEETQKESQNGKVEMVANTEPVKKEIVEETQKESQNGKVETVINAEPVKNDSSPDKSGNNEDNTVDNKEENVGDNKMDVDEKVDTKTDSGSVGGTDKEKPDSTDSEKLENCDPIKETDNVKTDATIKTNGTHKEILKNGISEDKTEEIASEIKGKDKVVEDAAVEKNGVETAEKV